MHELGIAQNILEIVQQSVPEDLAPDVRKIKLRIGRFAGVVPDSLDFCFGVIAGETNMKQAVLSIEQVPTVSLCKECGHRFQVEDLAFLCPFCESANLELISGKELEIVEIEVADTSSEAL